MSIKFKIIAFITLLLILSLGITLYFLSYMKYKPLLKDEILNRIVFNLENHDFNIKKYLQKDYSFEEIKELNSVLDYNDALYYIKLMDIKGYRSAIFQKDVINIKVDREKIHSSISIGSPVKKRYKALKPEVLDNPPSVKLDLVLQMDYKSKFQQYINSFKGMITNINGYFNYEDEMDEGMRKIRQLTGDSQSKRVERDKLRDAYTKKLNEMLRFLNRAAATCEVRKKYLNKKHIKESFKQIERHGRHNNKKKLIDLNKGKNTLLSQLSYLKSIVDKGKKTIIYIDEDDRINKTKFDESFAPMKKLLNSARSGIINIQQSLEYLNKGIQTIKILKSSVDGKIKKGEKIFDSVDLIKKYVKIETITSKKTYRTIGYYEIGVSDNVIAAKVAPIIISGIKSSTTILILSIVAGLFLAMYLVYPISQLTGSVKKISKDLGYRIKIDRKDEYGYLAKEFNHMLDQIQDYSEGLEQKVRERTAELRKTLSKIQALKKQQDGDYFLTSLLFKPLTVNEVKSKKVKVDFFIEQKKKFKFAQYEASMLGGDICIAHNLKLGNKDYIAFVNSDAMGKSIQGAGGAIIMGVVFNYMINEIKSLGGSSASPKKWLKDSFNRLQDIFLPFDGSMFISCFMGLVEEKTGMLTFFNAEHPFPIIYRNKKADFIEKEIRIHKIGLFGEERKIPISTFQLKRNDVVIIGSDGRDDLCFGKDNKGNRIINEDETLILKNIEQSNGKLDGIVKRLKKSGDITDDLSFIKIAYSPKK